MEVGPPGACDTRYPQAEATVGFPFDDAIQGEQFTVISDLWKLVVDITWYNYDVTIVRWHYKATHIPGHHNIEGINKRTKAGPKILEPVS